VLPLSTNPREGWKGSLKGEVSVTLKEEIMNSKRLKRSLLMNESGEYLPEVSDNLCSRVASYDVEEFQRSRQLSRAGTGVFSPSLRNRAETGDSYAFDEFEEEDTQAGLADDSDTFRYQTEEGGVEGNHCEGEQEQQDEDWEEAEEPPPDPSGGSGRGKSSRSTHGAPKSPQTMFPSLVLNGTTMSTIPQPHDSSWGDDDGGGVPMTGALFGAAVSTSLLNEGGKTARRLNDDVILDLKEAIERIGAPNRRQIHSLGLRSAYESSSVGGEPLYTHSKPADHSRSRGVECIDYIFFSSHSLSPLKLLSLPLLTSLSGDDPSQSLVKMDLTWDPPPPSFRDLFDNHHRDLPHGQQEGRDHRLQAVRNMKERLTRLLKEGDDGSGRFWGGRWVPFATENLRRTHSWLPNDSFASSHLALCAFLQINDDYTSTQWTSS
jgi:hypothetical protein